MNILNHISIKNLKLNKKRTISTLIGIILSVALICAVASMGMSFQATLIENAINETGYYHLQIGNVDEKEKETIKNNRDVKNIQEILEVGYAKLEKCQNQDKPYVHVYSMEQNVFQDLKFQLIEGRFPQNSNEIIMSQHIKENGKVSYQVGEVITFDVGERKLQDGTELQSYNPYLLEEETLSDMHKQYTFKIVGIIERPEYSFERYSDPGYTVITTGIEEGKTNLYISLKNPREYRTVIPQLLGMNEYEDSNVLQGNEESKFDSYEVNRELLRWEAFAFSDSTVSMLFSAMGVVIVIIMITSIFCIRNSFAIATTEKIKMYAMLASVGTTKKQIKKNVLTEGAIYGLFGIPLGIVSGFLAVYILIQIVNALLGEYLLAHVNGLVFKISFLPVIVSIILGGITIYLSAISSARKASKITPIEGLRGANDIKMPKKKLKVPKIIFKLFGMGGVLAYKNLKRSKKKYRTTVISIAVSIFIFITMNSFITNMFDMTGNYYQEYDYNIIINNNDLTQEEMNKIVSLENIESYQTLYMARGDVYKITDLSKINLSEDEELSEDVYFDEEKQEFIRTGEKFSAPQIVALEDADFKKYVQKIGVNYEEVKTLGILCDQYKTYEEETRQRKRDEKISLSNRRSNARKISRRNLNNKSRRFK